MKLEDDQTAFLALRPNRVASISTYNRVQTPDNWNNWQEKEWLLNNDVQIPQSDSDSRVEHTGKAAELKTDLTFHLFTYLLTYLI